MGRSYNRGRIKDNPLADLIADVLSQCDNCRARPYVTERGTRKVCAECAAAFDDDTPALNETESR